MLGFGVPGILIVALLIVGALGALGTGAWFSDVETSNDNMMAAGSLDLKIDGVDTNVVKIDVSNMRPGNQPNRTFALTNAGSITGYLDLESIVVTERENGRLDPEIEAGDTTPNVGELGSVLDLRLLHDLNGDGWRQAGEDIIWEGMIENMGSAYDTNIEIGPGETVYINVLVNWWSTADDNLTMTDSVEIDMSFELGQKESQ